MKGYGVGTSRPPSSSSTRITLRGGPTSGTDRGRAGRADAREGSRLVPVRGHRSVANDRVVFSLVSPLGDTPFAMSAGTFTQLHFHVVFAVKYRAAVLAPAWRPRLFQYLVGMFAQSDHQLLGVGGVEDHVHLAFGMRPTAALSDWVGAIKRGSARWVNDAGLTPGRFAWQEGYGAFSVSRSHLPALLTYIEQQEAHHHTETFSTEYRRILAQLGVEFDERFLPKEPG